jgi:hypothetical protein
MNRSREHDFANYLGISLWISSKELTPDRITQIVGIEPSYVRVRGALIPGQGVGRRPEFDVHEWQFRRQLDLKPGNCVAQDFEKTINEFLDQIESSTTQIRELSEHHHVTISFVYHVDELPYIGLTRQQVIAIAALGARLDYDFMVEGSGSDQSEDHDHPVEVR